MLAAPLVSPAKTSPVHVDTALASSGPWLDHLNAWRAATGLAPLVENSTWSLGDYDHAVYMVKNDLVTHYETPGVAYYTLDGDTAARNSNIYVSSSTSTADTQAIDWWMGAPFHAMAMMDPRLTSTGFGSYREVKSGWDMGAALDVVRGNSFTGGNFPLFFPANGTTEPLTQYSGNEFPDPLQACPGYTNAGLPVFVEVGGNVATVATGASFTGNGAPLDYCVIDSTNPTLGSYLTPRGGVIVVPRFPLQAGVRYVVSVTVNGAPYSWSFSVGPLSSSTSSGGWQSLGGSLSSGPGASSCSSANIDAFVLGGGGVPWFKVWNGSTWGAWTSVGGNVTSNPTASCQPTSNVIDLYTEGVDSALYHRQWATTAWLPWEKLGGSLTSGPGSTSCAVGTSDVFVLGGDGVVWRKHMQTGIWSGWINVGGNVMGNPAVVCEPGTSDIDLFVEGTDHALYHRLWNGTAWGAWQNLGGSLSSSPAAASCGAGKTDVFVLGGSGVMWHKGFNGTSWSGWQSVGGSWTSDPGAVCRAGSSTVNLFERGGDSALWTGTAAGS